MPSKSDAMTTLKLYTEDLQIAKSLIERDEMVTRHYYYEQCYPLFKSVYDNYYTDCKCCKEFMDEIYIIVIAPSKTGKCQMENYRGESTLTSWLKAVCLTYCYKKYKLKKRIPLFDPLPDSTENDEEIDGGIDRLGGKDVSIGLDFGRMNRADVEVLLGMMHNARYRKLIRLRYLEQLTNEETAKALGLTMANYYNMHKRAKEQYEEVRRKEECYG